MYEILALTPGAGVETPVQLAVRLVGCRGIQYFGRLSDVARTALVNNGLTTDPLLTRSRALVARASRCVEDAPRT